VQAAERDVPASDCGGAREPCFADVFNAGHLGLYRETVTRIRVRKGLKPSQDIADHMGSLELSANHFRAA